MSSKMSLKTLTVTTVVVVYCFLLALGEVTQPSSQLNDDVFIDASLYPEARRDESVVDDMHGHNISNPYHWMENIKSKETRQYIADLNNITMSYLAEPEMRALWRKSFLGTGQYVERTNYEKRGEYYYYMKDSVIYQTKNFTDDGIVFLNSNELSQDGSLYIAKYSWSYDGTILAAALSDGGSDWLTVKFWKNTGEELPDVIKGVKFSNLAFLENEGLFYCGYPGYNSSVDGLSQTTDEFHSVYYHKINTSWEDDVLVAQNRDDPNLIARVRVTDNQRYLFVQWQTGLTYQVYFYDFVVSGRTIEKTLPMRRFINSIDYGVMWNYEDDFFLLTRKDSPNYELMRMNINNSPNDSFIEPFIPEDPKRLIKYVFVGGKDKLLVVYTQNGYDQTSVFDIKSGAFLGTVDLPLSVTTQVFSSTACEEAIITIESFFEPSTVYRVDLSKPGPYQAEVLYRPKVSGGFEPDEFVVKEVFFASKDGTKIPMFVLHLKNLTLDGQNALFLTSYGCYERTETPMFGAIYFVFIKLTGGVVAIPNVRGGGIYGETWHEAGMKEKKQNTFDDFIAAAQYMVDEGYTKPAKIVTYGSSGGALMVVAAAQQRPDLFGAVIAHAGPYDMLRFNKFTIGNVWTSEFGDPEDPDDFKYLYKYSPLHNIQNPDEQEWPAMYLTTSDNDDRVVPSHTLSFTAALHQALKQSNITQRKPVITYVQHGGGHGIKSGIQYLNFFTFAQKTLNLTVRPFIEDVRPFIKDVRPFIEDVTDSTVAVDTVATSESWLSSVGSAYSTMTSIKVR